MPKQNIIYYYILNNNRDIFNYIHYHVLIKHTLCKAVAYICNTSINISNKLFVIPKQNIIS